MTPSWADKAKFVHHAMMECEIEEQLEFRLGPELFQLVSKIGLEKLWKMHRLDFAPGGKVQELLKRAAEEKI